MSKNSATNDRNSDNLFENNSSQEQQHRIKLELAASRKTSEKEKRVKKFKFKKGARVTFRRDNLHRTLTHHQQKMGVED